MAGMREQEMPRLDEHLVREETREEMVRGERIISAPAREPHADRHCRLDYLISAAAAPGYVTSSDLLTRAGATSEFATDTCVRREGIDPATGTRYLEELAFEVVHTQTGNPRLAQREAAIREQTLRRAIEAVCNVLGIVLGPEEQALLQSLDPAGLESLLAALETHHRWPQP